MAADLAGKRFIDIDCPIGRRTFQIQTMEISQSLKLRNRIGMIVDSEIDGFIGHTEVAPGLPDDHDRGGLATAAVPTGAVTRKKRREKPVGQWAFGLDESGSHRFDDFGAGENVSLDRKMIAGF